MEERTVRVTVSGKGGEVEEITKLELQYKHACEIALASVGQPDRLDNVKYRDELAQKLERLRTPS